ncbi:uncharacterized protein LOC142776332 isoform X2 [Rhipicephalus microplus]|uniref:uncharacterized protein LOC142776332 isoform X2 n=1 Tax=Rhipicephalus microplus TaxID=6941 RepID=UPI003F6B0E20
MVSLLGETRMTVIYHPFRTYKIRRSALSLIAHDTPVQAIYSKTTKSYLFMFEIIFSPGDIEERSSDGQPANVATADGARRMAISSLYISQPFWNIKFPSRSDRDSQQGHAPPPRDDVITNPFKTNTAGMIRRL